MTQPTPTAAPPALLNITLGVMLAGAVLGARRGAMAAGVFILLVALGLPDPAPQRLRRAADLRRDRADRRPLRGVLPFVLEHHPHRALADFKGVFG